MTHSFMLALSPLAFFLQLAMIELGRRLRRRSRLADDAASRAAVAPAVSTVLSLMGLVLAFSFSNAATRLEASRKAILDEANAIESAWLLIDVAEPDVRPALTDMFRRYVDARIAAYQGYEGLPDAAEYHRQLEISSDVLVQAWSVAVAGTSVTVNRPLLLRALGAVSDTASARTLSLTTHLPPAVFGFLFAIVLIGAMFIGAELGGAPGRQWAYQVIVATVLTATLYAILDMEYPRLGAFQLLAAADALIVDLRAFMH